MRYFYDTEFLEDGKTIELISIGIVAEDGRELYLVNRDAPWKRIERDDWLMANVVSQLPSPIDGHDPLIKDRMTISWMVEHFLLDYDHGGKPDIELWANYAACDFVALYQLFGKMIDLPRGIPMFTHDLQQEVRRLGNPALPEQSAGQHNALDDARHVKTMFDSL